MCDEPLISIVIPVYNIESYIKQTLDSVMSQDYKNFEIILVDDGSTDKTLAVCKAISFNNSRIKVIHQDNKGVSAARNNGIKNANGEYISFVDGDDIVAPNLIARMYQVMKNTEVDLVTSGYSRNPCELGNLTDIKPKVLERFNALKELPYNQSFTYSVWGKLFKTEIVKKILFDEKTGILEDYLFICNYLVNTHSVAVISDKLYCYMIRDGSALNKKFTPKRLDLIYSYDKSFEIVNRISKNLLPYYRCSYLADLISLKGTILDNKKEYYYLSVVDKKINQLKSSFLKGSRKKRLLILLYKVNPFLYYKVTSFYMRVKNFINNKLFA